VLGAHTARQRTFTRDDINFLQAMANILAGAVERHKSETALEESAQKLRFLNSQLLAAQEKERQKLSHELHEDLGQTLQALKMQTNYIKQRLPKDHQDLYQECEDLLLHLSRIINQVRGLSWELRPQALDDLGLLAALRSLIEDFCKHYDIQRCRTDFDEIDALFPAADQINICRIFQEALSNIGEHSQATDVALSIKKSEAGVSFALFDNGKGLDAQKVMAYSQSRTGLGLHAMEERVKILGGSLRIDSRPDWGTKLHFVVPFPSVVSSQ
jgi:signal transduction histidine kinase